MKEPVSFANTDTVLMNREMYFEKLRDMAGTKVGFLDTFEGYSSQYSYCLVDKKLSGMFKFIREYEKINY